MIEQLPEFSVTEISAAIKKMVETTFSQVRVKGEIFGCKRADSGHYYLSLKDENAILSAVCWKGVAMSLAVKPEDGLEVVATGRITTFAGPVLCSNSLKNANKSLPLRACLIRLTKSRYRFCRQLSVW